MTDFVVIGIIVALMVFIIVKRVKARKSGKGGGCGCGCSGCSSAGYCSGEHKQ